MEDRQDLPYRTEITVGILAGGAARRMAGHDKGWLQLAGRPLIHHVLARLRGQGAALFISANRSLAQYRALGVPVVTDEQAGYPGPLMGMLSVLRQARTPWVLFVPCDSPHLPPDLGRCLWQQAQQTGADIVCAADHERWHPVVALVRRELLGDLEDFLAAGGRRVRDWYARHRCEPLVFPDPEAFVNLNAPEDLQRLQAGPAAGVAR